jgi:tetratricopeptide (TPR) repeat protein
MAELSGVWMDGKRRIRTRAGALRLASLAAALSAAMLSACAGSGPLAGLGATGAEGEPIDSPLGSYLAGRFARSERDTAAAAEFYEDALAEDPDNPALLQRTFLAMLAEGRMERAIELAGRRAEDEPRAVISEMVLAIEDIRTGRLASARERLQQKEQGGFGSLLRPLALAWIEAGLKHPDEALKALSEVEDRNAFSAFRNFHQALIADFLGRGEIAEAAYLEGREGGAGVPTRVLIAHASFLSRSGRMEEAAKLLDEQLERQPENSVLRYARRELAAGRALKPLVSGVAEGVAEAFLGAAGALAQDRTADAARVYAQLALHLRPRFDAAQMLLGELLANDKRWDEAIEAFRRVPAESPYSWEARIHIANALNKQDKPDEAAALLRAMSEERPDDASALVSLADMLRGRERYRMAADAYASALERVGSLEERHWPLLYARGIALERSKEWERAEADFLNALKLKPDQPLVLNYLGYSWVEQGKNLDRAREMIEKAVAQRPNDGYIIDSLGWVLFRMGDYKGAVRHLERAVELRPEDPTINEHLGDAYWRVGRRLEARFQWRHALALGPDKERTEQIAQKIDNGLALEVSRGAS